MCASQGDAGLYRIQAVGPLFVKRYLAGNYFNKLINGSIADQDKTLSLRLKCLAFGSEDVCDALSPTGESGAQFIRSHINSLSWIHTYLAAEINL